MKRIVSFLKPANIFDLFGFPFSLIVGLGSSISVNLKWQIINEYLIWFVSLSLVSWILACYLIFRTKVNHTAGFTVEIRPKSEFWLKKKTIRASLWLTIIIIPVLWSWYYIEKVQKEELFTILITQINYDDGTNTGLAESITEELKKVTSSIKDIKIIGTSETFNLLESTDEDIDNFGKKYDADLIIWGRMTARGLLNKISLYYKNLQPNYKDVKSSQHYSNSFVTLLLQPEDPILNSTNNKTKKWLNNKKELDSFRLPVFSKLIYLQPQNDNFLIDSISTENIKYISLVSAGIAFLKKSDFDNAIQTITKAIEVKHKPKETIQKGYDYYIRAIGYFNSGNFERCIEDNNFAIRLNPTNLRAIWNRGLAYLLSDKNIQAYKDFDFLVKNNFPSIGPLHDRGLALYGMKKYLKAKKDFQQVVNSKEINVEGYYYIVLANLGNTFTQLAEYDSAEVCYKRQLEINDYDSMPLNNLGVLYIRKRNYKEAEKYLLNSLKLNKDFKLAKYNLAYIYNSTFNKQEQAVPLIDEVLKIDSNDYYANYLKAIYSMDKGSLWIDTTGSFKEIKKHHQLLQKYREHTKPDAKKYLFKSISLNPRFVDAYDYLIKYLEPNRKELQIIFDKIDNEIAKDSLFIEGYNFRGFLRLQIYDLSGSETDYKKVIELNPEYFDAYISLAKVFFSQGKDKEGLKKLNQVIELNPAYENAYYWLGKYYELKKDYIRALKEYEKYSEVSKDNIIPKEVREIKKMLKIKN